MTYSAGMAEAARAAAARAAAAWAAAAKGADDEWTTEATMPTEQQICCAFAINKHKEVQSKRFASKRP